MASLPLLNGSSPSLAERSCKGMGGGDWGQWMRGQAEQFCTTWFTCGACGGLQPSHSPELWHSMVWVIKPIKPVYKSAERCREGERGMENILQVSCCVLFELFFPFTLILSQVLFNWHLNLKFKVRQADGRILKTILKGLLKVSLGWEM